MKETLIIDKSLTQRDISDVLWLNKLGQRVDHNLYPDSPVRLMGYHFENANYIDYPFVTIGVAVDIEHALTENPHLSSLFKKTGLGFEFRDFDLKKKMEEFYFKELATVFQVKESPSRNLHVNILFSNEYSTCENIDHSSSLIIELNITNFLIRYMDYVHDESISEEDVVYASLSKLANVLLPVKEHFENKVLSGKFLESFLKYMSMQYSHSSIESIMLNQLLDN